MEEKSGRRRITGFLTGLSALMLTVSLAAKYAAGYIARCWGRRGRGRPISVDVVAPNFGPALVVSTEEFEDAGDQLRADGYHTRTLLWVTWLEIVRKVAVVVSSLGLLITFVVWLASREE